MDYEALMQVTSALRDEEKDADFVTGFDEAEIKDSEDNHEDLWPNAQDQPVVIIDDDLAHDDEVIAKSAERKFPPQFPGRSAELDKDYPDVRSLIEDNDAELDNVERIVETFCHFLPEFMQENSHNEYMAHHGNDQGLRRHWYHWMCHRDAEGLAKTMWKALPVQVAADWCSQLSYSS